MWRCCVVFRRVREESSRLPEDWDPHVCDGKDADAERWECTQVSSNWSRLWRHNYCCLWSHMIAITFIFYSKREVALQTKLMKTLLRVATKYQTVLLSNAFPSSLLDPLLRMSMACDPNIRKIVQEILHTLIDRHGNKPRLRLVKYFMFFLRIFSFQHLVFSYRTKFLYFHLTSTLYVNLWCFIQISLLIITTL